MALANESVKLTSPSGERQRQEGWLRPPQFNPAHSGDEVAMGISIAVALHAIPLIVLILRATHPMPAELDDESKAMVSKPVIAASLRP